MVPGGWLIPALKGTISGAGGDFLLKYAADLSGQAAADSVVMEVVE